jgi:hypothetical protein
MTQVLNVEDFRILQLLIRAFPLAIAIVGAQRLEGDT